ncbi:hypothetical protein SAMN04488543_0803 [Friedmanniella luteola]|uniref:Uncharacterized protein n=1 Tax=Friedmanniella luteola TaxID=546871 RepID=A0A1H1N6Z2_9ACTN|nr:hypothetical protein [Friedmanniella luteola]SDR94687.1 hypothetical protein SAMN04488543_0803 [Friedmanniella luteola]
MPEDDPARGPAEVLDTGADRGWSRARRRGVSLLVLVALLTTAVVVLLDRSAPASSPGPSATAPPAGTADGPPGPPVVLRRSGPVPAGLDEGTLYARSADTVFRVDLGTGRVTATPAAVPAPGPVSFVPGPAGVLVRPVEDGPGLLVPDDGAARPLRGLLSAGAQVLPAGRGRLWVSELMDGRSSTLALTSFDGTPTGTSVRENGYFLPDGTGGLLLVDSGGVYERVRGSWRRLAVGTALASGRHHQLLASCSGDVYCESLTLVLRDRARREQHAVLEGTDIPLPGGGSLSADGRYLATLAAEDPDADGNGRALVVELETGRVVKQMVVPATSPDVSAVTAWSPAGPRLVGLDQGQLFVLDAATGRTTRPDLGLPAGTRLVQLALRSATAP